ncbi:hypothetical protein [Neokomagataea tanensis]|uniref:hypothetical protein n=1 Tax=Neokomagataea tanensis TaxID=661191 RepID=UPI0011429061|nr:hypothetical protein [Neokomagataea tanensis]
MTIAFYRNAAPAFLAKLAATALLLSSSASIIPQAAFAAHHHATKPKALPILPPVLATCSTTHRANP